MRYLLDTNVVSEVRKPSPNPGVATWFSGTDSADLYLSVLVVGEVRQGIERLRLRGDPEQAAIFERWLETLKSEFGDRLLPITTAVAERWGTVSAGRPLPVVDGLLAATAVEHDLTLVTRGESLLSTSGVAVLSPWS